MKKNKFRILIILLFSSVIFSCQTKRVVSQRASDFPGEHSDSLVAYIERTRCFGTCPYYSIHIYRSGYVLYVGIDHVPNVGRYFTYLPYEKLKSIGSAAEELGYFELNDEYRNPYLTDFPTIYTEVRFRGKRKKITHYDSEPPASLIQMENYIDSLFNEQTNWQVHPDQNYKD